jgi:dihydrofolate reductase
MQKLVYSSITSLDGFVADEHGRFDWSVPDAEVHAFINDRERLVATALLGRRLYEVMSAWETVDPAGVSPEEGDYAAVWHATDKVVYSTTLAHVTTARTRLERSFDPARVRELKRDSPGPLSVGGPRLAAQALAAGLVDEVSVLVSPVVVGGGTPFLPAGLRLDLELVAERRFAAGVVHLDYRVRP